MALIQINVPDDVKQRADAAFARNGITTPSAMKMMVAQVANEGLCSVWRHGRSND